VYDSPDAADKVETETPKGPRSTNPSLLAKAGMYNGSNVWPQGSDAPQLEPAFKDLGSLIVKVGQSLAKHCDVYGTREGLFQILKKTNPVKSVDPNARPDVLHRLIASSKACKARLLHYFPNKDAGEKLAEDAASWCGWHLDHGALTGKFFFFFFSLLLIRKTRKGLTSAMFMKDDLLPVPNPDPEAGLYIRDRSGKVVKAVIPADCIAFQMGQCSQIESGGILRATWHSVQAAVGPAAIGVARNTFAVFMVLPVPSNLY